MAQLLLAREAVAPDHNALVRWRSALKTVVDSAPEGQYFDVVEASGPISPAPTDPAVTKWLRELEPLLRDALDFVPGEQLQFPVIQGPDTPFPDHAPLQRLTMLRLVAAKAAWAQGRHDDALRLIDENLALSRAWLGAEEGCFPLIAAVSAWQSALDGVQWLCRQPDLTGEQAHALREQLAGDGDVLPVALSRAVRGEYTFVFDSVLARVPDTRNPDRALAVVGSLGMNADPEAPEPGEPQLRVADHPILDRTATRVAYAEALEPYLAAFRPGGEMPRAATSARLGPLLALYRTELRELVAYASLDGEPSPQQVAAADAVVTRVQNPIGKALLLFIVPEWDPMLTVAFRREAQRRALVALLAWREKGSPATWDDLVAAGLLAEPPADPFSAAPLHYEIASGRVWSVFVDGRDDGGAGDPENLGMPPDLSWSLPAAFPRR